MSLFIVFMLFASILLETAHQLFLKMAGDNPKRYVIYCFWGIVMYILLLVVWFRVLKDLPLGFALPIMGLNFVAVALAGSYFFKETINLKRWTGIIIILVGFILVWIGGAN